MASMKQLESKIYIPIIIIIIITLGKLPGNVNRDFVCVCVCRMFAGALFITAERKRRTQRKKCLSVVK